MTSKTVGKTWTSITDNGKTYQNSSNVNLELYKQSTDTAPSEDVGGIVIPPFMNFTQPASGYVFARCPVNQITIYENEFIG